MKWPNTITIVRHGQSAYNALRPKKEADPEYREFVREFEANPQSKRTRALAETLHSKYRLGVSDYDTPLTDEGARQALVTGERLHSAIGLPHAVLYSPYVRTRMTLEKINEGWPELGGVKKVEDDRIREQEHGLALLYNDWRMFHVFHPEQKKFRDLMGPYWYTYPQGESVSNVRDRIRLHTDMLIREYSGMDVLLVSHHMTVLSLRANYERLTPEEFIALDEKEKPVNCGVTHYKCNPYEGRAGKLELMFYNRRLW